MKIGIITFWESQDNYGQLLQVFALQHYLKKKGHKPFLIRYKSQIKQKSKLQRILSLWKIASPKHLKVYLKLKQNQKQSYIFNKSNPRHFDEFRNKHLTLSPTIYHSIDELKKENWSNVDAFICGSDQIWSPSKVKENILAFFLQFTPKNKKIIAYAASFGRPKLPKEYEEILPQLLTHFSFVGLREQTGVDLCVKANRKDSVLVSDPTLLLNSNDYISSILNKKIINNNAIFVYLLNWETAFPTNEIKSYASEKKLHINFFGSHGMESKNLFPIVDDLTIPSWVEKMASSKIVFTNSFHGTVMAITFKKEFITFPLIGESSKMNGRITTLLTKLGLENRIYTPNKIVSSILETPINWENVDKKLTNFRVKSELFLKESLSI